MKGFRARGQALVEFALVLPILLMVLMGIFDLGRLFYVYNVSANVAREGARYAATVEGQARTETQIVTEAKSYAPGLGSDLDITVVPSAASSRTSGSPITVTVTFRYDPLTLFVPGNFNVTTKAVVYAE